MNKTSTLLGGILLFSLTVMAQPATTHRVGQKTLLLKDSLRNRPLTTEVWYPTADPYAEQDRAFSPFVQVTTVRNGIVVNKRYPLILISHGTGGNRLALHWLAAPLAQAGFVVAAVDHWGNTFDNPIPECFVKFWERPQDLSYVLTALLRDSTLGKMIDGNRIGAAGFSIGGYTVIALAGGEMDYQALSTFLKTKEGRKEAAIPEMPDLIKLVDDPAIVASAKNAPPLRDKRIKAVFAMAPAVGQGFTDKKQVASIEIPVYIVGAESDGIAPVKTNARHYHQLIGKSEFTLLEGKVGHYVFLGEAKEELRKAAPIYFGDDPTVNRPAIHDKVARLAVRYFLNHLK